MIKKKIDRTILSTFEDLLEIRFDIDSKINELLIEKLNERKADQQFNAPQD